MAHVRQQIRDEVLTRLAGLGPPATASRVYADQVLPAINIYTADEEADPTVILTPGVSARLLTVKIEIHSKAGTDLFDDEIDNVASQIETALSDDRTKFAMCKTWDYQGMNIEYSNQGETAAGTATLEYIFNYWVSDSDPEQGV